MLYILAFLLVLTCAAADRIIGWGEWGRTKPALATVAALAGIAYALHMPVPAIATFPVAFMVWRTPGWGLMGGSINPEPSHAPGTFFRHLFALAFIVPAYYAHVNLLAAAAYLVVFAFVATALAIANYYDNAHANQTIEAVRGLMLGVALTATFVFPIT